MVVPSIAIREGVKKFFEITSDHFMEHYGKKARFFIYNSSNLNQLDNFSSSNGISVMINFQINQGDRIVLNGQNGCGKSSILKLLWGDNIEYSGEIIKNNQLKISYIPQDTSFLYGSLTEYAENHQIDESLFKTILRKLDFSRTQLEKNIENLSAGQRKKVLISGSLCQQAHLYIWDEPLNYIDIFSRMQIEQLLLTFKPTLLFVEHDKQFQDNIATKIIQI